MASGLQMQRQPKLPDQETCTPILQAPRSLSNFAPPTVRDRSWFGRKIRIAALRILS